MTSSQIFSLAFFAVLLALLYQIAVIFTPFLVPSLWAIMLCRISFPLHRRIRRALGGRENVAAGVATVLIMVVGVIPVVYVTFVVVEQSIIAYSSAHEWVLRGGLKQIPQYVSTLPLAGGLVQEQIGRYIVEGAGVEEAVINGLKAVGTVVLAKLSGAARNAFYLTSDFLVMLFTLFFYFVTENVCMRGCTGRCRCRIATSTIS